MSALPLFDLLMSVESPTGAGPHAAEGERASRWAGHLVQEALAEVAHIRNMDEDLGTGRGNGAFDRQAAALLQGAYEDWAQRARALLVRVERVERRGYRVDGDEQLHDEVGRVSAMLKITLDSLDEAEAQVRRGEVYTLDEVRRELRIGDHK